MTILIVEERYSGHLLQYVRIVAEHAMSRGNRVELALGEAALDSPEYRLHLQPLHLPTTTFEGPLTPSLMNAVAADVGADFVVVPHGDELAVRAGVTRARLEKPATLLIMRDPRWESEAKGRRLLWNLAKFAAITRASWRRGVTIVWLRSLGYRGRDLHAVDPFIADGRLSEIEIAGIATRRDLGLADDVFWFVVTGAITDRKNVPLIFRCLTSLQRRCNRKLGLALIGSHRTSQPIDSASLNAVDASDVSVVNCDRVLTNLEMNAAVAASDAVVVAYDSHSPNSTMVKAVALGRRIVVAGPQSVRAFARDMGLDLVGTVDAASLESLLARALSSPQPSPRFDVASRHDFASALLDSGTGLRASAQLRQRRGVFHRMRPCSSRSGRTRQVSALR